MKPFTKIMTAFVLGVAIQGGIYFYLDQVVFAPTTSFNISGAESKSDKNFPSVDGRKYYSYDHEYMAVVSESSVEIYKSDDDEPTKLNLHGHKISYFEWMPDRELAIMGLYGGRDDKVVMARLDPANPEHEVDTELEDVPKGSKIDDVAYSTATNVVYMKVKLGPNKYRVYRTDANYDTRRVYMQATDIGRIGVFYDEDKLFYDNAKTGEVYMFDGITSGWRAINPNGRYRLIGVDSDRYIYLAKVNEKDEIIRVERGKLGVGFETLFTYKEPHSLDDVDVDMVLDLVANGSEEIEK